MGYPWSDKFISATVAANRAGRRATPDPLTEEEREQERIRLAGQATIRPREEEPVADLNEYARRVDADAEAAGYLPDAADAQGDRARLRIGTVEGRYADPEDRTGRLSRLLRYPGNVSAYALGPDAAATEFLRRSLGQTRLDEPALNPDNPEVMEGARRAALRGERADVGTETGAPLIDRMLVAPSSPVASVVPPDAGPVDVATQVFRRQPMPMPKDDRATAQADLDARLQAIEDTYTAKLGRADIERDLGHIDDAEKTRLYGEAQREREASRTAIARENAKPSALRTLIDEYSPDLLTIPAVSGIPGVSQLAQAATFLRPDALARLGEQARDEWRDLSAETSAAADRATKGDPARLLAGGPQGQALSPERAKMAKEAAGIAFSHLGSALTEEEVPLQGENRGVPVETGGAQVLRIASQAAPAPLVAKYGRALARAGVSGRDVVPTDSMEPYEPGEPAGTTVARGLRFARSFADPAEILTGNYWRDVGNIAATNQGLYDEGGALVRGLRMDPNSPDAKALVALHLGGDFLVPFEEIAVAPLAGVRVASRATRAARLAAKEGATAADAARAGLAASDLPGTTRAAGIGLPADARTDPHAVAAEVRYRAASRQAASTGRVTVPNNVRADVDQTLSKLGVDPGEAHQAFVADVGGPDRAAGPERRRVEAEFRAVAKSKGATDLQVDAALGMLEGSANRAVQTQPDVFPTPEAYYAAVRFETAEKWEPQRAAGGAMYEEGRAPVPAFYSTLQRQVGFVFDRTGAKQMKPESLLAAVKKAVKQEELDWTGFEDWLKDRKEPVTREEAEAWAAQSRVELREVVRSDAYNEGYDRLKTEYNVATTDAHRRYLTSLDRAETAEARQAARAAYDAEIRPARAEFDRKEAELRANVESEETRYAPFAVAGDRKNYRELIATLPEDLTPETYYSSHWPDVPNPVFHVRMTDRVDANGNKVLFIDEVQSDWLQGLREKSGKDKAEDVASLESQLADNRVAQENMLRERMAPRLAEDWPDSDVIRSETLAELESDPWWRELTDEEAGIVDELTELQGKNIPPAPWLESWHELAIKRIIRYAAENGYDEVAFTPGKRIWEAVAWEDPSKLPGIQHFYDRVIPDTLRKVGKRWGAKTGETRIALGGEPETVVTFPITDKVRESVMFEGQPLFERSAAAIAPEAAEQIIAAAVKEPGPAELAAKRLEKTRFITDAEVLNILGNPERPEYLQGVVDFMVEQRQRVLDGKMEPRDLAKGYFLTIASQGGTERTIDAVNSALSQMVVMEGPDGKLAVAREYVPKNAKYGKRILGDGKNPLAGRKRVITEAEELASQGWTVKRRVAPLDVPNEYTVADAGKYVRPEEAAAAWLYSPAGQRALDAISAGKVDVDAWMDGAAVRKAFGDDRFGTNMVFDTSTPESLGMDGVFALTDKINAARGDLEAIGAAFEELFSKALGENVKSLRGISRGKLGFIKHLLGFGDVATFDVVELAAWLTGKARPRKGDPGYRVFQVVKPEVDTAIVGDALVRKVDQRFDRLVRLGKVNLGDTPEWAAKHILHHWFWDRAKGAETTHKGLYLGMKAEAGPEGVIRGATFADPRTGQIVAQVFETGDFRTLLHEDGHAARIAFPDDPGVFEDVILKHYGNADGALDVAGEERFANDFRTFMERAVLPKKAPPGLRGVFVALRDLLLSAWERVRGKKHGVPAPVAEMFERWRAANPPPAVPGAAPKMVRPDFTGAKAHKTPEVVYRAGGASPYRRENLAEAARVSTIEPTLAAELGVKPGDEVALGDLYGRVLRRALEDDTRHRFPTRLVPITTRTVVPATRVAPISRRVRETLRAAMGSTPEELAKQLKLVPGPEGKDIAVVPLRPREADGLASILREIRSYGMDTFLPERLREATAADLARVTPAEYNEVVQILRDMEAGPATRRSRIVETMPAGILEGIHSALFREAEWTPQGHRDEGLVRRAVPRTLTHTIEKAFVKDDPFKRFDQIPKEILHRLMQRLGRISDELMDEVKTLDAALAEEERLRSVGIPPVKGRPEIIRHMAEAARPKVPLDRKARLAFSVLEPVHGVDSQTVNAALMHKPQLLGDPQLRAEWLDAVEHVFFDSELRVSERERRGLRALQDGVETDDDVSAVNYGLYRRHKAIIQRADEILTAFEGDAKGLATKALLKQKLDAYEWFYYPDQEGQPQWWRIRELFGSQKRKSVPRADDAVLQLIGRARAHEAVAEFLQELYQHKLRLTSEDIYDSMLAKKPASRDTGRRVARVEDHLRSLGVTTPEEMNLAHKALIYANQGLERAIEGPGWRHFVHQADVAEQARVAAMTNAERAAYDAGGSGTPRTAIEDRLRRSSHALLGKFKTRADLDKAVKAMRADLRRRGLSEDLVRHGPPANPADIDEFGEAVMGAVNDILSGNDGNRVIQWPGETMPDSRYTGVTDPMAYVAAREFLDGFGIHPTSKGPLQPAGLDTAAGEHVWLPLGVVDEIKKTVEENAPVGLDFASKRKFEKWLDDYGFLKPIKDALGLTGFINVAALLKQGLTAGLFLPQIPFYMAQYFGNLAYIYAHQGIGGLRRQGLFAVQHPMFVADVTLAMADGVPGRAATRAIVTKDGRILTSHDVARAALENGLNAQWVKSEFIQKVDQDVQRYLRTSRKWMDKITVGGYRRALVDASGSIDNSMRLGVFTDGLKQGMNPADAAEIARRVVLDYSQLSELERGVLRHAILFYAYIRRNLANQWWALWHNPSRVLGQIRLANGLNKVVFGEDAQLLTNDSTAGRLLLTGKDAARHGYAGIRWMLPPLSAVDGFMLGSQILNMSNHADFTQLWNRANPVLQLLARSAYRQDPFFGSDISAPRQNIVPAWFVMWDQAVLGGAGQRFFRYELAPADDPWDAINPVAGQREVYVAKNWVAWQMFRKLSGADRTIGILDSLDRADLGVVEAIPQAAARSEWYRGMLRSLNEGRADTDRLDEVIYTGGARARPELGRIGELAGVIGFTPVYTPSREKLEQDAFRSVRHALEQKEKDEGRTIR